MFSSNLFAVTAKNQNDDFAKQVKNHHHLFRQHDYLKEPQMIASSIFIISNKMFAQKNVEKNLKSTKKQLSG